MVSQVSAAPAGRRWLVTLAALTTLLAGALPTGSAEAAAQPRLLQLRAPKRMVQGSQYIVRVTARNRRARAVRGVVSVTLSSNRRAGPIGLGRRRQALGARGKTVVMVPARVGRSVGTGRRFLVACLRAGGVRSCKARRVTIKPIRTGPPGPRGPAYVVGARTTTPPDPVFPNVGNSGYDVQHYDLTLRYDHMTNRFLPGTRTLITAVNTAGTGVLQFSLDFAMEGVTRVKVNGEVAEFWRESGSGHLNKLVIESPAVIRRGAEFVTEIMYQGAPVEIASASVVRDGWLRVDTPGFEGAYVVNEPIGAMGWFPNNNTPRDKATFEFHNTVSTDRTAIANGELDPAAPVSNGDGTWTWNWYMRRPMATYLSTSSVGNFDYTGSTGTGTGLPFYRAISNNNTPAEKDTINGVISREDATIADLSTLFGPYPFESAGVVVDQIDGIQAVLEVQSRIHFPARSLVSPWVLAHEVSHQWAGNSVTGPTWRDVWIQEGWATWGAIWWAHEFNGSPVNTADYFDLYYIPGSGSCPGTNQWCVPPSEVTGETLFDSFTTYYRPMIMFEAQRQIMGDEKFRGLLTRWQTDFRYGNAGRAEWVSLTKEMDGGTRNLRWSQFFAEWLDGRTMPTINPSNFDTP